MPPPFNWVPGFTFQKKLYSTVAAFRTDKFLAASVRYFCIFLCPWVNADSRVLKVHEDPSHVGRHYPSFVRRMPTVPPESPHARDRVGGEFYHGPT